MLKKDHVLSWINRCYEVLEENRQYLTKLDTAIGDADHGNNMHRGFKKVHIQFETLQDKDIGAILKSVAMTLISSVGGASGPLYGTFFLQMGTKAGSKEELSPKEVAQIWRAGLEGVKMRGKAEPGDKTMVDVLTPVVESLERDVEAGKSLVEAIDQAVEAAEKGVQDTIPLIARKGRASYLGERSKGHQDPGATSSKLILQALRDSLS